MSGAGLPCKPRVGEKLATRVVVMFHPRAHNEPQIRTQRRLVLRKHAAPSLVDLGRQEREHLAIRDAVLAVSVFAAPDQRMRRPVQGMLELHVGDVLLVGESRPNGTLRTIQIGLQGPLRSALKTTRPS